MKNLQELLERFITLLDEERRLLIKSIEDKEASKALLELTDKKDKILKEIFTYDKEELKKYGDYIQKIDELTQRNRALAMNNIEFLNEIFDAIFSHTSPAQYTKEGDIKSKKEGLFNKKV